MTLHFSFVSSINNLVSSVVSPVALQLAHSIRLYPRLSHLLANLLGMLPYKHNAAYRNESINFYRAIIDLADRRDMVSRGITVDEGGQDDFNYRQWDIYFKREMHALEGRKAMFVMLLISNYQCFLLTDGVHSSWWYSE